MHVKWALDRSLFKVSLHFTSSSMVMYKDVSSANSFILELISEMMSFMYSMKSKGPRTDPCGTPDCSCFEEEVLPSKMTDCVRFCK